MPGQQLRQHAGVASLEVLHDHEDDPGPRRQVGKELLECFDAASGGPQRDDQCARWLHFARPPGWTRPASLATHGHTSRQLTTCRKSYTGWEANVGARCRQFGATVQPDSVVWVLVGHAPPVRSLPLPPAPGCAREHQIAKGDVKILARVLPSVRAGRRRMNT